MNPAKSFDYRKLFDLSGRVALVIGGGSGIGQAGAEGMAAQTERIRLHRQTKGERLQTAAHFLLVPLDLRGIDGTSAAWFHCSRNRVQGSIDNARCAGIHIASSPTNNIARTTPPSTRGSLGVA